MIFLILLFHILPLFFHKSDQPVFYNYSKNYIILITILIFLATILSLIIPFLNKKFKRWNVLYNSIIFYLILLFMTVAGETFLRLTSPDPFIRYRQWGHKKSIWVGFEAAPDSSWSLNLGARENKQTYSTDIDGFRMNVNSPNWRNDKSKNKIFAVGGSCVFGFGLNNDETWVHLLGDELETKVPYHVINAGNSGHDSYQVLIRAYKKILPYRPQAIIYYQSMNDTRQFGNDWRTYKPIPDNIIFSETLHDYHESEFKSKNIYIRTLLFRYFYEVYRNLSQKVKTIPLEDNKKNHNAIKKEKSYKEPLTDKLLDSSKNYYIQNIATLHDICKRNGIKLIPCTFIIDDDEMEEKYINFIKYYNQSLRNFCKKENIEIIDIEKDFKNKKNKKNYFYFDGYHPNVFGSNYIAETIKTKIVDILEK